MDLQPKHENIHNSNEYDEKLYSKKAIKINITAVSSGWYKPLTKI